MKRWLAAVTLTGIGVAVFLKARRDTKAVQERWAQATDQI